MLNSIQSSLIKKISFIFLIPYALWLVTSYRYHFIDGANLLFHEAGHLVFKPFGEVVYFLGGTIGQLAFPAICFGSFWRRDQRFEAGICGVWFAESLMYMAEYMRDAQARVLPLVGGHTHDWHWLLSHFGVLRHSEALADFSHGVASLLLLICLLILFRDAFAGLFDE